LQALGEAVENEISRVRMTIAKDGTVDVTAAPLVLEDRAWNVTISADRVTSDDPYLAIKTTQRVLYDNARANLADGIDEQIFLNERGEVCEGTITNVFAEIEGVMYTPPLASGVLPGVLRYSLISQGGVVERVLMPEDLLTANVFVGNSLRGLIEARLI
jgi:4-amino-4-deoxychorismate lyase